MIQRLAACSVSVFLAVSPAAASLPGGSYQDYANRVRKASDAAVGSQFLSLPLPMNNLLAGKWQLGIDGGYSSADSGAVNLKGEMLSVGYTRAFADHWGYYLLAFGNNMSVRSGGREVLVTPFANNVPLDTPEYAEFSNGNGAARQLGIGAMMVWDPLVTGEESSSLPVYGGVIIDDLNLSGLTVDYLMATGADAGQTGTMDLSGSYTFFMPTAGIQYSRNVGKNWKVVPNFLLSVSVNSLPQKGRITGTAPKVFDISGTSGSAGYGDADFRALVAAFGTTILYRPWGVGANLGATLFRSTVGKAMYDGVNKVFQLDLSWRFGNYAR